MKRIRSGYLVYDTLAPEHPIQQVETKGEFYSLISKMYPLAKRQKLLLYDLRTEQFVSR